MADNLAGKNRKEWRPKRPDREGMKRRVLKKGTTAAASAYSTGARHDRKRKLPAVTLPQYDFMKDEPK
jgi:hypothetical protein